MADATTRHHLIVSRFWHHPDIKIALTSDGIGIGMSLDDFLTALLEEVGSPAGVFTKAKLAERVHAAAARVVTGMKAETARVV